MRIRRTAGSAIGVLLLALAACDDGGEQDLSRAPQGPITFCHNGRVHTNNANGVIQAGHQNHPEDIIPRFDYDGGSFAGMNADRLDWIANGCAPPATEPIEPASPSTDATETTDATDTTAGSATTDATDTTAGSATTDATDTTAGSATTDATDTTAGSATTDGSQGPETTLGLASESTSPPTSATPGATGAPVVTTAAPREPTTTRPVRPTTTRPGRPTTTGPAGSTTTTPGGPAVPGTDVGPGGGSTPPPGPTTTTAAGPGTTLSGQAATTTTGPRGAPAAAPSSAGPGGSVAPGDTIPRTGRDTTPLTLIAALLLVLGCLAVMLVRRPRTGPS